MDEYPSIRCTKMLALHTTVLLYKSFTGEGFNLLSEEFKFLEQDLGYVHLRNVTFVVDEDRKKIMEETGVRTVHALAKGQLYVVRPLNGSMPRTQVRLVESLPEVEYDPYDKGYFYLKETGEKISTALDLYAYDRKVRVQGHLNEKDLQISNPGSTDLGPCDL